ncbi:hypothetical protein HYH02_000787 [Chlamydomonas schloesseri]|uniref:TOG domain-containing protein n=1 Tax=Chlamydomonas schloesseri TaxID=2026947 RepID=A0A835WWH4_9CHLO|nr:hypothetical protein HYH02_000787 [Chlamydomonas schloesseri]|eukprot:KAG2454961.1 hypothetical protein HYH02_000787 [Chlamydomonas schloesseri]
MSSLDWTSIREDLQASTKQRLSGLESLEALLKRASLNKAELGELLDLSPGLLSDANSKVAQQTLEALCVVVKRQDVSLGPYASLIVPSVAERLGDSRQPVRAQALHVLVALFKALKPDVVLEKLNPLWQHKSWKVKHGLLEVIAEVASTGDVSTFISGRDQNNAVLKQIVRMMEEPDMTVREAALGCLEEIHRQAPAAVVNAVQASSLRPERQREVFSRLGADTVPVDVAPKRGGADEPAAPNAASAYMQGAADTAPAERISGSGAGGSTAAAREMQARRQSSAAAGPGPATSAAAAAAATVKRGGFKDGGGMTVDGELPQVAPILITSERELRAEMEAATALLAQAPCLDWQGRMTAMQRLEGLVLGGALEYECFFEAMKGLAQALSQQFKERRSTIARQTCHLIGVLATHMGARFEPHALTLLPVLFGVVVITVAVMAESADLGVRTVLRHCQTQRLLQLVSDVVCKDKSPKTRQFCANYICLILEEWDVGVWARNTEPLEAALRAAAQDSLGDTRAAARTAMALYNSAQPERARAFLQRLDSGLQDKLSAALGVATKPAKPAPSTFSRQSIKTFIARQPSAAEDIIVVMPGPKSSPRPTEVVATAPLPQPVEAVAVPRPRAGRTSNAFAAAPLAASSQEAAAATEVPVALPRPAASTATARPARKSLGLPPGRIPGGSADLTSLLGEPSSTSAVDPVTQARAAALRRPRMSALPYDLPQRVPAEAPAASTSGATVREPSAAGRVPCPAPMESRPPMPPAPSAVPSSSRTSNAWQLQAERSAPDLTTTAAATAPATTSSAATAAAQPGGSGGAVMGSGLVPLSRVVAAIMGGPRTWTEKVDALNALSAHIRASLVAGGIAGGHSSDSTAPLPLLAAEPDKVLAALERVRERVMEALEDPHLKVLSAALALVGDTVRHYGRVLEPQLDRLLPLLLSKGAEHKEGLRVACADVLSECGTSYRPDVLLPALTKSLDLVKLPRGKQGALDFFKAHAGRWGPLQPTQLKHWLVRLAPLLDDRTPELRRRAAEVLDLLLAAAWAREPIAYVAYQHNSPDVGPLRRYLASSHTVAAALGGASLTAAAQPHSTSLNGSSSQLGATASALQQQMAGLALSGVAPPAIGDNRRQLPGNAPLLNPGVLPPSVAAYGAPPRGGHGASSNGASGTAATQLLPPGGLAPAVEEVQRHAVSMDGAAQARGWAGTGLGPQAALQQQQQPAIAAWVSSGSRPSYDGMPSTSGTQDHTLQPGTHRSSAPGSSAAFAAEAVRGAYGAGPAPPTPASFAPPQPLSLYTGPCLAPASLSHGGGRPRLQAPADPTAQLVFLGQLLDTARAAVSGGGSQEQQTAMEALADAAECCGREAWVRTFPLLMVEVTGCWLPHASSGLRMMGLALLKELLMHQPALFGETNLESTLGLLLAGVGDSSRDVSMTGSQALKQLLSRASPAPALQLLQAALPREREAHRRTPGDKGARLVAVLEGMRALAARLERPELHRLSFIALPDTGCSLVEGLVANLNDPETSVRRGAVVTLADLWYRLGHSVRDVLQVLAASNYNLLCIYYLKMHGITVRTDVEDPTQHPLVLGGGAGGGGVLGL